MSHSASAALAGPAAGLWLRALTCARGPALCLLGPGGELLDASASARSLYGWGSGPLPEWSFPGFFPPEERRRLDGTLAAAAALGVLETGATHRRADGSTFPARITLTALPDGGAAAGFLMQTVDETASARREAVRAAAEERLHDLLRSLPDTLLVFDREPRLLSVTPEDGCPFGAPGELLGRGSDDPAWRLAGADPLGVRRVLRTGGPLAPWEAEWTGSREPRTLSLAAAPLQGPGGQPLGVVVAARDVTGLRGREEEREARERLEELSRRLVEELEAERARLSRELHDAVGGGLAALGLLLAGDAEPGARIADATAAVRELHARVRELAQELRPKVLDELGLLPALCWLAHRYRAAGLEVAVTHRNTGERWEPEVETACFRIAQEALANAARHAGAAAVTLHLEGTPSSARLWVQDDGRGFDPDAPRPRSTGLAGMRERARLLGGALVVESAPGAGTYVEVELPLLRQPGAGGDRCP
ncbi:MAG: PAS domain-containing protein [Armatimonadota bacterium]